jgi:hypothetical protein
VVATEERAVRTLGELGDRNAVRRLDAALHVFAKPIAAVDEEVIEAHASPAVLPHLRHARVPEPGHAHLGVAVQFAVGVHELRVRDERVEPLPLVRGETGLASVVGVGGELDGRLAVFALRLLAREKRRVRHVHLLVARVQVATPDQRFTRAVRSFRARHDGKRRFLRAA